MMMFPTGDGSFSAPGRFKTGALRKAEEEARCVACDEGLPKKELHTRVSYESPHVQLQFCADCADEYDNNPPPGHVEGIIGDRKDHARREGE